MRSHCSRPTTSPRSGRGRIILRHSVGLEFVLSRERRQSEGSPTGHRFRFQFLVSKLLNPARCRADRHYRVARKCPETRSRASIEGAQGHPHSPDAGPWERSFSEQEPRHGCAQARQAANVPATPWPVFPFFGRGDLNRKSEGAAFVPLEETLRELRADSLAAAFRGSRRDADLYMIGNRRPNWRRKKETADEAWR